MVVNGLQDENVESRYSVDLDSQNETKEELKVMLTRLRNKGAKILAGSEALMDKSVDLTNDFNSLKYRFYFLSFSDELKKYSDGLFGYTLEVSPFSNHILLEIKTVDEGAEEFIVYKKTNSINEAVSARDLLETDRQELSNFFSNLSQTNKATHIIPFEGRLFVIKPVDDDSWSESQANIDVKNIRDAKKNLLAKIVDPQIKKTAKDVSTTKKKR